MPDTGLSLAGREIQLSVVDPDGDVVEEYVTRTDDQYGYYRVENVGGFELAGEYRLEAANSSRDRSAASRCASSW